MANGLAEIKKSLIYQILAGQHPVGGKMPSCRALAAQHRINRNTANRLYQELAREGLIKAVRGHGFVVVAQPGRAPATTSTLRDHLLTAIREAKLLGVSREAFLQLVLEVTDGLLERPKPAIALVECNEADATALAAEVAAHLSLPVQPLLLAAVEASPEGVAASYDIVCAPLYHLREVGEALAAAREKVVAVHAAPDIAVLGEIAQLPPKTRLGVVCEKPTTQQYLLSAVAMVCGGQPRSCLVSQKRELARLAGAVDLLVDVPSCHEEVARLLPETPILTASFRIDVESLKPLRQAVDSILRANLNQVLSGAR